MTFSLAKATAWVTGDLITAARIQTIDTNQSRAVDGYAGGTYNPSAAITVGGSGLQLTTTFAMGAAASLTGASGGYILLSSGSYLQIGSGGSFSVASGGSGALQSGSAFDIESGAHLDINGSNGLLITSGGEEEVESGGTLTVASGGTVTLASGCTVTVTDHEDVTLTAYNGRVYVFPGGVYHAESFVTVRSGTQIWMEQTALGATDGFWVALTGVPRTATVTTITAWLQGDPVTRSNLPSDLPSLRFYSQDATDGSWTLIDSEDDPSVSPGGYETKHAIVLSGLSQSLHQGTATTFFIKVEGESSTWSVTGLRVFSIQVEYTTTTWSLD